MIRISARSLILAAVVVMLALGAGAAFATGNAADAPAHESTVAQSRPVDDLESGEVAEPGEAEEDESNHPGDVSEDEAEGPDRPITGPHLERASRIALDYIGEGRVTGTEIEDEESYYEIEVTRDDGTQVDVQLDESFNVVGTG